MEKEAHLGPKCPPIPFSQAGGQAARAAHVHGKRLAWEL